MATRKRASKTSKKVQLDIDVKSPSKRTNKKINSKLKKMGFGVVCLAVVLLVAGAVGGYFAIKHLVRNDCFEIVGQDELTLTLDEDYIDQGVKVVAFGKDDSDKVEIQTNLTSNADGSYSANEEGTYYITYTVKNLKYGSVFKIQKIRLITFVEACEQDEINSAQGVANE